MKKFLALFLSALLITSAISGCNSGNEDSDSHSGGSSQENSDSAPEAAQANLKFYIWSDEESYASQVVDQYNAIDEKIQVEMVTIPNDDYQDKLKVLLSAGSDADVVGLKSTSDVAQYRKTESLLDITDRVKSGDLDISKYGAMWDSSYPDGQIFALPNRTTCWMLIYNTDLFEEAGIEMPDQLTWQEYAELAKKLTKGEGADKQWGGYWVNWYTQFVATQKGVYVNSDDITAVQESLELLNQLYNVDKSHMSLGEMKATDMQYMADFENGTVAMMPQGEWMINMLLADTAAGKTDVNWDIAPMPVPEGVEPGTTWGEFSFAGITSNTQNADAAFNFLEYLCGAESAEIYASAGVIPAYTDENGEKAFREAVGKDSVSVIFNAKKVQGSPADDNYAQIVTIYDENADLYLLGEKTIEETMENFLAQRQEYMDQK